MKNQKGQTLIALLFFVLIGIMITVTSAIVLASNSLAASNLAIGEVTREEAESGGETALVNLLRNSSYTGETLNINADTVVITVTGDVNKVIDSVATSGNFVRKVEIIVSYSNNVLVPVSWKEVFN